MNMVIASFGTGPLPLPTSRQGILWEVGRGSGLERHIGREPDRKEMMR